MCACVEISGRGLIQITGGRGRFSAALYNAESWLFTTAPAASYIARDRLERDRFTERRPSIRSPSHESGFPPVSERTRCVR